jgi:phosphoglycerate dehydrogenase-like enzyme
MRILFCGSTFPDAPEYLRRALRDQDEHEVLVWDGNDLAGVPTDVDVLIPKMHRVDATLMDACGVRMIQQWGAGLEGVDLDAAKTRGVVVANLAATGVNADSVAEHAVLLILSLLRNLPRAQANVRAGLLGAPSGTMLAGRTVCLYGLGAIALPIANRLRSFGVRMIGITRNPTAQKVAEFNLDRCFSTEEKEPCLRQTDVLVLCVRLSDETRDCIGEQELAWLPKGACLVNVARGGLVNYAALCASLKSGHLGGAGLDVFWEEPIALSDPILGYDNVIATPHIAGITSTSLADIARGVAGNVERFEAGLPVLNRAV